MRGDRKKAASSFKSSALKACGNPQLSPELRHTFRKTKKQDEGDNVHPQRLCEAGTPYPEPSMLDFVKCRNSKEFGILQSFKLRVDGW